VKLPLSNYVWYDGKLIQLKNAKVPITTHAIHYGTSIFEEKLKMELSISAKKIK